MKRRVVITGMGTVTPFGSGLDAFWEGLVLGRSSIRKISRFPVENFPCRIAAEVDSEFFKTQGECGRVMKMARAAAAQAWKDAALDKGEREFGLGLSLGWEDQDVTDGNIDPPASFSLLSGVDEFRRDFALSGPLLSCFSACAAGTQLVEEAARCIRLGEADAILAGASDSRIHPMGLWGYTRLGALATHYNEDPERASRPFDRKRNGFVMGEGAGFVVLEEKSRAEKRGARIHAEILGAASTADAYSITAPAGDGSVAAHSIRLCLERAGVWPESVDYINAHGTSTPANDAAEVKALEVAFGNRAEKIPVGSFKSMIGHLAMASGMVEIIGTILAMKQGILPPNLNLEDPEFSLNFAGPRSRELPLHRVLKTSFGFGGQNSSILLGSAQA